MLSSLIKKQIEILGQGVALNTVRKVESLTVSDDGVVIEIKGDPQEAMESVINQYINLSRQIAQTTIKAIIEKYPDFNECFLMTDKIIVNK